MSRATVRAAVAAFLAPPSIPNVGSVQAHPPKLTMAGDFYKMSTAGAGTGMVIRVFLGDQHERRIALGGAHNGRKWRQYTVDLMCTLDSTTSRAEDADSANDTILDALVTRLQSDRQLGAPGVIFQAGEGTESGGDDIRVHAGLPVAMSDSIVRIFSTVTFDCVEVLAT